MEEEVSFSLKTWKALYDNIPLLQALVFGHRLPDLNRIYRLHWTNNLVYTSRWATYLIFKYVHQAAVILNGRNNDLSFLMDI